MNKILHVAILMGCFSCASTKVKVNSAYPEGLRMDSLNVMAVMIGPVSQPVLPLIDAAAFNAKTNRIADQILDDEQKVVDLFKANLIKALDEKFPSRVFTADLLDVEKFKHYRAENGVQIDNKNFPIVFFGKSDINLVDFDNGKNVYSIFKDNPALKNSIAAFIRQSGKSNVILCYNRLAVVGVGPFGGSGALRLESYLFIYGMLGDLLVDGFAWMKPVSIQGANIQDYQAQLDVHSELTKLLVEKLATYIKK